ncbi:MAG: hypothetical protein KY476_16690 [Planctomycetes bacterium]|nr:hypothetical protein [Planctomycetota bacterium]
MTVAKKAQKLLDPRKLDLPPAPRVVAIEVEDYVDWAGDDALRIYVTIPDDTRDEELTGENGLQLKDAIYDRLLAHGIELFPYVRLRTESERREELAEQRK